MKRIWEKWQNQEEELQGELEIGTRGVEMGYGFSKTLPKVWKKCQNRSHTQISPNVDNRLGESRHNQWSGRKIGPVAYGSDWGRGQLVS